VKRCLNVRSSGHSGVYRISQVHTSFHVEIIFIQILLHLTNRSCFTSSPSVCLPSHHTRTFTHARHHRHFPLPTSPLCLPSQLMSRFDACFVFLSFHRRRHLKSFPVLFLCLFMFSFHRLPSPPLKIDLFCPFATNLPLSFFRNLVFLPPPVSQCLTQFSNW
jgi:hypothetical protein